MPIKTRRKLFLSLTILFLVIGTSLVFYSRGVRLDFENWEFVQTGGIYLKTEPSEAAIQMDEEPIDNKSGILQSGILINNLTPKTYKIFITKDGYHPWEKEVKVESSTVSVFDGIILFPKQKPELVASSTDKFYLENTRFLVKNNEELSFDKNLITGNEVVTFGESGLALTYRINNESYYLVNIFEPKNPLNLTALFTQLKENQLRLPGEVPILKILPYLYNDRKFVIMTEKAVYTLDAEKRILSQIGPRVKDFAFTGNEVLWLDDKGISSFNLILRNRSELTLPPELKTAELAKIEISPSGENIVIVKKNKELVILDRASSKVKTLGKDVNQFVFSPNSKKLAFISQGKFLSVYAVKDDVKKDEFILKNIDNPWTKIQEIVWHEDNNYLFLKDGEDNLYFVEINDAPPVNAIKVAARVRSLTYNEKNDSLYFSDDKGIWRIKL